MSVSREEKQRAYVEARVKEYGSVGASTPDGLTQRAWAALCKHYGVSARPQKARTLEEALRAVAELAK